MNLNQHRRDLERVERILENTPAIDREYIAPREEFLARVRRVNEALQRHGHRAGIVFSDEHYSGDVPYLGGNTNVSIEQVAGIVGPNGFHLAAGLEQVIARNPKAVRVKGRGLLRGLEVRDVDPAAVIEKAQAAGLLVLRSGANIIRLAPPLVIDEAEIDEGVALLAKAIR